MKIKLRNNNGGQIQKIITMSCYPIHIIIIFLCFSSVLEGQILRYAPHSQNFKGNVKRIDTYQYSSPNFDTLDVSSTEELKGKLIVTRQFDKSTGNLLRIFNRVHKIVFSLHFVYLAKNPFPKKMLAIV